MSSWICAQVLQVVQILDRLRQVAASESVEDLVMSYSSLLQVCSIGYLHYA